MGRVLTRENIALGKQPYVDKIQLAARQGGMDTSAVTLWATTGTYAQLTAAVAMEAISSSANDAAAGTGARTVYVEGLDNNYDVVSETVTLNGTNAVALVNTYLAINKAYVVTAGSGLVNAGTVDIRTVSGSVIKTRINSSAILRGQACSFIYTTPRYTVGLLSSVSFSGKTITGDLEMYVITKDTAGIEKGIGAGALSLSNTGFNPAAGGRIDFGTGILIPEKTLVELRGIVSAGTGVGYANAELLVFDAKNNGIF